MDVLVNTESTERYAVGVVVDCNRLNVREYPSKDAEVITTIPKGTEVEIDLETVEMDDAGNNWYYVYMASGIGGFCVSRYIEVQP